MLLGRLKDKEGWGMGHKNCRGPAIPREQEVRFVLDVGGGLNCIVLKGLILLQATAVGSRGGLSHSSPSSGTPSTTRGIGGVSFRQDS